MPKASKTKTKSKAKKTKGGKNKKAGKKVSKAATNKANNKRLTVIATAFAYAVAHDMVDLERSTKVMSAATLEETKTVIKSIQSSEKLAATSEGRAAEWWAAGPKALKNADTVMFFGKMSGKKSTIDLKDFMDKCVGMIRLKSRDQGPSEGKIAEEKRLEAFANCDWTNREEMYTLWPHHIQRQIELARAKRVTQEVNIDYFSLRLPLSTDYLIDSAELIVGTHQKICLIGEGGSGKSTLFRAMASGEIKEFPQHLHVHHMKELEVSPDSKSLLDTVVHAHTYLIALRQCKEELEKRIAGTHGHPEPTPEQLTGMKSNLSLVNTNLRMQRSDDAEENAAKSLRVLGFDDIAQQKSINSLSGGLRMRVALCAAFFVAADILLLDEPTNHLDFPSLLWLENKLRSYPKSFIMVCHDREILNNVVSSVMQITDEKGLKYYPLRFEAYEKKRQGDEKKMSDSVEKFLMRNRNVDPSSPLAVTAAKKKKWLHDYQRKLVLRAGQFTFPPPVDLKVDNHQIGTTPEPEEVSVIKVTDVRFSYDPLTLPYIFDTPISIDIKMGTRMGVMGPNGAGKSTFLKLLTGRLQPVNGSVVKNQYGTVAYFSQHHSAEMDLTTTAMEFMVTSYPEETNVGRLRMHLGKVGISGGLGDTRMTDISQGLRSCVLFAKMTYKCPNLLIMDEPTNFLDLETVDALIGATNKYKGSLLLVSHSRLFLNSCANSYLSIVPGQFNIYQTLEECERATYTFIADMENGDKVRIGAGNLAKHGSNAGSGSSSEVQSETPTAGISI